MKTPRNPGFGVFSFFSKMVTAQAFASLPCHFEWREAPREIFLNIALDFSSLALVEMTG
ncbi:MAG: hypothetical protein IPG44_12665 [Anaerolineales bacterium]|jgi:hypothetical protein|nr:hypothetical protein [Chloroflexota bacterium]MBK6646571.1 hypothetical protein [Anaerolineales bacterium]MCC6986326.1 hypothetical protein [Anaerolineales bacterium]